MLLWGMSCVKAQTSDVDKMFPNVVLTRENYDKVKTALEKADNTLSLIHISEPTRPY